MGESFRGGSGRRNYRLTPEGLGKTVGDAMYEAVTNRAQQPSASPGSLAGWEVSPQAPILPDESSVTWPMPVERFQYGHFLAPGDVILSSRLESFFSFLTRTFDHSRFAHAALTFVTPHSYEAVDRSYLIEATFSGVDLNSFSEIVAPSKVYEDTKDKPRYIVGIKRLEADWFTHEMRPLVGGRMLRYIKDDDYNFALLAALAADRSKWFFRLRDKLFGRAPTIKDYLKRSKRFAPIDFICSGFVQFAYVDMVRAAVEEGLLSPDMAEMAHQDVMFAPWVSSQTSMEELMAVKPLELASSERLKWKYLIYGGEVHKVSTEQEVNDFFDKVNADRHGRYKP